MSSSNKNGGYRGYVQPYLLNTLPLQGPRGVQGFDGSDGYTGNQGFVGKDGRLGGNGGAGSQGDAGPTGVDGEQGFQGSVGFEGLVGGFVENPVSTGMIFRINPVAGKFSNKLFYPDFQLFESKLATPDGACGNINTSVWNNKSNLINIGVLNSQLGANEPAGFFINQMVKPKDLYMISYNLTFFLMSSIPNIFFFECRNLSTGLTYPGSRSSVSTKSDLRKHLSHTFLATATPGSQIGLFVSHDEVGEGGDNNICIQILNSNFLIV
jgi:hypothetical protein